jgi:TonB family protein
MKRTNFIVASWSAMMFFGSAWVIAAEAQASDPAVPQSSTAEPMLLDFARPCASPPAEGELSGPGVVKPRLTPKHPPKKPRIPDEVAEELGGKAIIQMLLLVNEEGRVSQAKVLKSSGSAMVDRVGLEATREWQLAPGTINGEVGCMWFTFRLSWFSVP